MKKPKTQDYGFIGHDIGTTADRLDEENFPITNAEVEDAIRQLLRERVLANRRRRFDRDLSTYQWYNSNR